MHAARICKRLLKLMGTPAGLAAFGLREVALTCVLERFLLEEGNAS